MDLSKISNVPVPEDKQTRDYHTTSLPFLRKNGNRKTVALITYGIPCCRNGILQLPFTVQKRERVPAKGYISDQLTDEAIGLLIVPKHLTSLLCFTWLIMLAPAK